MLKIQYKNNIYEVYFELVKKEKPAPVERVFKEILIITLEKCEGNISTCIDIINKNNLNIIIKEIKVIE